MTDSKRPWWADREVVETWVEQKRFDATLAYLDGLAVAVEHRIAYGVDDSAVAAKQALDGLDALWHNDRLVVARMDFDPSVELLLTVGEDGVNAHLAAAEPSTPEPLPFQRDDPALVMVCACTHDYPRHTAVGCMELGCWCNRFRYSHDDERASNA
ncbi:hypothetical protein SEA_AMOHNITION_56 [Mycobacterium phage Amohnition]|uniref:Uncharacterized protein n=1 Tax=Mycobacterium phage Amohnition TaxID=2015874 RepID=A0A222ZNN1_9CAUD|nr:hypothetical protein I5G85_gp43 [Mycobacterium phage Amohnition]ASR86336.1 hypothetical protein SEA_AMOHNITION_56 [Mycobacterium phage Amohnition]